jgi:hypothetical protein
LAAAIVMVACVPLRYGGDWRGVVVMVSLAIVAFLSTLVDARKK